MTWPYARPLSYILYIYNNVIYYGGGVVKNEILGPRAKLNQILYT